MRPHQIFAAMSPEQFEGILAALKEESPEAVKSTTVAAASVLKFRPKFLLKQPPAKQKKHVKSALSRGNANDLAEEILAIYFLKCRLPILTEWLDLFELEHEDGILKQEETPCPDAAVVEKKVAEFRALSGDKGDRELLLRVFAGQASIDWPALDALLDAGKSA